MDKFTPEQRKEAYEHAEASLRLEGLDPSGRPRYEALKNRVINGEITAREASRITLEYFKAQAEKEDQE